MLVWLKEMSNSFFRQPFKSTDLKRLDRQLALLLDGGQDHLAGLVLKELALVLIHPGVLLSKHLGACLCGRG